MGGRQRWALISVCVSVAMASIDNSILNVALPAMSGSTGASNSELQWIVDAYTLAFASLLLTAGSIGDRYGRRRLLVAGLSFFIVGSSVAAMSSTPATLVVCRTVMGVGGACISTASLSLLSNVFPEQRERAKAVGIWAATASACIAVGPLAGGFLLRHFWWGSIFLVNVPLGVGLIIASRWSLPESKNPESSPLDPLGVVLSIAALTSLLWAFIEGGEMGWTDPSIIVAGVCGIVLVGAFITWEIHNPRPMLELSLFANAQFSGATAIATLSLFVGAGTLFVLGQVLQFGLGLSPLEAGLRMAPMAVVMAVMAVMGQRIVQRFGSRQAISVGLALSGVSCLMWMLVDVDTTFLPLQSVMLVYGLGQGLVFGPCMAAAMGAAPREKSGAAAGTINTIRQSGFALGVAVLGSVLASTFASRMRSRGTDLGLSSQDVDTSAESMAGALRLATRLGGTLEPELTATARSAFVHATTVTMAACAGVCAFALLVAQRFVPAKPRQPVG